mmetsp:Transcript_16462/g.36449  ORF Transcript_16462/g.36449 Transcript_16462/m.36449 type:complete len:330 (-) Transcript_16462:607-1596(-)
MRYLSSRASTSLRRISTTTSRRVAAMHSRERVMDCTLLWLLPPGPFSDTWRAPSPPSLPSLPPRPSLPWGLSEAAGAGEGVGEVEEGEEKESAEGRGVSTDSWELGEGGKLGEGHWGVGRGAGVEPSSASLTIRMKLYQAWNTWHFSHSRVSSAVYSASSCRVSFDGRATTSRWKPTSAYLRTFFSREVRPIGGGGLLLLLCSTPRTVRRLCAGSNRRYPALPLCSPSSWGRSFMYGKGLLSCVCRAASSALTPAKEMAANSRESSSDARYSVSTCVLTSLVIISKAATLAPRPWILTSCCAHTLLGTNTPCMRNPPDSIVRPTFRNTQ